MSTQEPDLIFDLSAVHNNHVDGLKIQNALKGSKEVVNEEVIEADFIREFADIIVQKTARGFRIVLDEGMVEKLKSGHKFDIGYGRVLALDERGDFAIVPINETQDECTYRIADEIVEEKGGDDYFPEGEDFAKATAERVIMSVNDALKFVKTW